MGANIASLIKHVSYLGLCGAPKCSVYRDSFLSIRCTDPEFRISVRFKIYPNVYKQKYPPVDAQKCVLGQKINKRLFVQCVHYNFNIQLDIPARCLLVSIQCNDKNQMWRKSYRQYTDKVNIMYIVVVHCNWCSFSTTLYKLIQYLSSLWIIRLRYQPTTICNLKTLNYS